MSELVEYDFLTSLDMFTEAQFSLLSTVQKHVEFYTDYQRKTWFFILLLWHQYFEKIMSISEISFLTLFKRYIMSKMY
jgi:hypothetical protein